MTWAAFGRILRPGINDLACVALLAAGAAAGAILEPSHAEVWVGGPALFAVPLLCSGILLLTGSRGAAVAAWVIHSVVLAACILGLLFAVLLVLMIITAFLGLVTGFVCVVLGANSALSIGWSRALMKPRGTAA